MGRAFAGRPAALAPHFRINTRCRWGTKLGQIYGLVGPSCYNHTNRMRRLPPLGRIVARNMFEPGLIALDLDGTLLTHDKLISSPNRAAVRRAIDAGIAVVLASGRMHEATVRYAHMLDMAANTPVVSYNGGLVRTVGGYTLSHRPVPPEVADYLIAFTRERGLHLNYYLNDTLYVTGMDEWSVLYNSRTGSVPVAVGDLGKFAGQSPTKLIIIGSNATTDDLLGPMRDHFGSSLYVTKTDDEYLEFMNADASKAAALEVAANFLGIPQSASAAFGDNQNDIPMLKWAAWGVAMANARPEVKLAAQEVGLSADEDGVAFGIDRLLAGRVVLI